MRISLLALMLGTGCALSTPTTKSASTATTTTTKSLTQRIMEQTSTQSTGGAGGSASYEAFLTAEENWTRLKRFRGFTFDPKVLNGDGPVRFVTDDGATGSAQCWAKLREQQKQQKELDYEVAYLRGYAWHLFGTALALKGHKVVVFEAAKLRGREQEWNISLKRNEGIVGAWCFDTG
ncbi:MAG UNVERIFIED_CONTAM: hypothetical protein LVR29_08570 [Microcystis novacekii LVE1205-3]|jgi:hypothetical protein